MKNIITVTVLFVIALIVFKTMYEREQINRGRAISRFLYEYHGLKVPAAEARFFNVELTTYDITVEEMEIFTK
jgi:hypothetical protein